VPAFGRRSAAGVSGSPLSIGDRPVLAGFDDDGISPAGKTTEAADSGRRLQHRID
jgi:hypothetical protein